MIVNPADSQQLANYAKASQISGKSVDGGAVTGGTTGRIALGAAAYVFFLDQYFFQNGY